MIITFTVVNENVSLVISRQLLTDVSTHLALLADHVSQEVSHFALDVIQPRVISFEEQVIVLFNTLLEECSYIVTLKGYHIPLIN